jgi:hypothetical protein
MPQDRPNDPKRLLVAPPPKERTKGLEPEPPPSWSHVSVTILGIREDLHLRGAVPQLTPEV